MNLQWGRCQANQFCAASSSAESLLVPRFPSEGVEDGARVQVAPPGFFLQGFLKKGGWGAVVSMMP